MATNAAFLAAIQALSVTGVTRHYDEPPANIHTADLPAFFPLMPGGALGERIVSCYASNKQRTIQAAIVIEPAGQGTQAQNYGRLAALMDNLETALAGMEKSQGGSLANFVDYDISAEILPVAGVEHWAIVATVTAYDVK